ncbi:hypothetical protein [Ramlibacter sp.]|uniref:hypothetical protein n=1 Tax=Ramlibacter sp. TaxID=1917967 RepID=UPI003D15120F
MAAKKPTAPIQVYGVLDANALLPPRLSDVLFDLQGAGLYKARWSEEIEKEFLRNWGSVVVKDQAVDARQLKKGAQHRLDCYRGVTEEYEIMGHLRPEILSKVPAEVQANDKHVAAAALQLRAALDEEGESGEVCLVTNNLRHLAVEQMKALGVEVLTPGAFIDKFAKDDRTADAVRKAASDLEDPPYNLDQLLGALVAHGSKAAVKELSKAWGVKPAKTPGKKPAKAAAKATRKAAPKKS